MLHLQSRIAAHLVSPASSVPISALRRLVSAAAPPNPSFAVEEYLVGTCGLTREQSFKASTKLCHLTSPSKPDAVLDILAGLGFSGADVAAVVGRDPQLLCASVEATLAPNVAGLTALGLSRPEVARLLLLHPGSFRRRSVVPKLRYYLPIFGSFGSFLRALSRGRHLLSCNLDNAVKPNVAFLHECGLNACDVAKLCIAQPWVLTSNLERVHPMVALAEAVGVPRGSGMFRLALQAVAFLSKDKIAAKVDCLKKMFRWSDADVGIAVSKFPGLLKLSEDILQSKSEFLISEVGFEPAYIASNPALLSCSLEGRVRPRYYVVKFLKENGLLDRDRSYYTAVVKSEKTFVEKYISPHNEAAPYLAQDYATSCRGEVPPRFIFASTNGGL